MSKCFNGLYCVHLELTSRCNKNCWMCGGRKIDKEISRENLYLGLDKDFRGFRQT